MTRDEFTAKYELHKLVAEGGPGVARSYFGRSRSTNAVVLVHFLDGGTGPDHQDTLARIEALGPEDRRLVLETCEVDGAMVVVTRFIWDFTTFDAWLASRRRPRARAEPPPAPPRPPAPPPAGEFTQLFGSPAAGSEPAESAPNQPASPPGEFTRLFDQQAAPPDQELRSSPGAGARDPSDVPAGGGEFTKLFKPPTTPESPAPSPPPAKAAKPGPGEFTRLFGEPVTPQSPESPPPPGRVPLPDDLARRLAGGAEPPRGSPGAPRVAPPQSTGPGDFTRMFGGADSPAQGGGPPISPAMPPSGQPRKPEEPLLPWQAGPAGRSSTDYLARLHGSAPVPPAESPPALPFPPAGSAPVPPVPPAPAGPGGWASEFTRALRRISLSGAPAEPEAPEDEADAPTSALPVVLIVGGFLLVLALAIILYFLLTMD